MKKLEDLLNRRIMELESERKASEDAKEARRNAFQEKLWTYPLTGGGIGFATSLVTGFFKGCGLFHYDPGKGNAYLFDTKDAGNGFWTFPLIGLAIGLLYAIVSSNKD